MPPEALDGFEFDEPDDHWLARVRQSLTGPGAEADRARDCDDVRDSHQSGDRIGAYALVRPLGSGGMGEVWLARRADGLFERDVAIKVIKRGMDTDAVVRRFNNERHLLASLHHPHIARMYDAGAAEDGRPFIVMEYVAGLPISEYCDANDLDVDARLELFRQACLAVHHAHRHLVLHRDLKPSNLLIAEDGNPKLLDFGIAKLLDGEGRPTNLTTDANMRLLTPRYASPEQITGESLTTATDVYSLGVIIFRLLTGKEPYDVGSGTRAEVERAITAQEPTRPSAAVRQRDDLPHAQIRRLQHRLRGDIDAIVLTALRKDPTQRYASAEQLAEDIRRHLAGSPLLAKRPGILSRTLRELRRRRRPLLTAIGGATIGIALAAAFIVYQYLMPVWTAEQLNSGRMTILGPQSNNVIYSVIFYNDSKARSLAHKKLIDESMLKEALKCYRSAARFARGDTVVLDEYHTVQMALAPAGNAHKKSVPDDVQLRLPLTYAYAQSWESPVMFTGKQLDAAERPDLRALGLLALLWGNVELTINAWTRINNESADPLVEALLGNIYLAMNRPELAYPRLLSAHRALPDSTNITVYLADAAARCGDTQQARHLLRTASEQDGLSDKTFPIERIEMCCLLDEGKADEALRIYEDTKVLANPVASMQLARYFDRQGDVRTAVDVLAKRAFTMDQTNMQAYCQLLESWWSRLSHKDREPLTAQARASDADPMTGFGNWLRCYARDKRHLQRFPSPHPLQAQSNWNNLQSLVSAQAMQLAGEELNQLAQQFAK
ncbi:MAG: protein kinase [Phycisphaerales bacterium]|nr:protein kinase [Phycisphaerales bacterium]